MPQSKAAQMADSLWLRLRPELVMLFDAALAEQMNAPRIADGVDVAEAEERYIAESAERQLARLRAKAAPAGRRKSAER